MNRVQRLLKPVIASVLCAGLAYFAGCAGGTEAGNPTIAGGTETGNPTSAKVRGRVVDSAGTPQESVLVRLLPSSYNPVTNAIAPDSMTALTDSAGGFEINITQTNYYRLTGLHALNRTQILRTSIAVLDSGVVESGTDTLSRPGAVNAYLSPSNLTANGFLYVPGTRISVRVAGAGFTLLDSVPAGRLSVAYYDASSGGSRFPGNGYMGIEVLPGDTVSIADDPPVQADSGVTVSGNGRSISYAMFQFVPINFMGTPFITLLSMAGPDTLGIVLYEMSAPGGTVDFGDSLFMLFGSIDSMRYAFYNKEIDSLNPTGFVSGGLLFSAFDTSTVISGSFLGGSSLLGVDLADSSIFPCSIRGTFSATRVP